MKTAFFLVALGLVLGTASGFAFARITENLPGHRTQAAFMDGLYVPIYSVFGGFAGVALGVMIAIVVALTRRKSG